MGTVISRPYEALLDEAVALLRQAETSNLKRFWELGARVAEFCDAQVKKKYRNRTVQTLAEDMVERGVLVGIADPTRYLYWAKAVHDTYVPEYLDQMASVGFSVYHARLLLSLDAEQREAIQSKMIDENGRILSGRKLQELMRAELRSDAVARVSEAIETISAAEAVTATPAQAAAEPPAAVSATAPEAVAGSPQQEPADAPAAPRTPAPAAANSATRETRAEREMPESPLKTLSQIEKVATKLLANIPDFIIVVNGMSQRGFDSDRAQRNYNTKLAEAKTALRDLIEPIQEVLRAIDENEPAP